MSPTPILDRQQPPPAPPPVKRGRGLVIGAAIGVALVFLPGNFLNGDPLTPLWLVAGFVSALFLGILLHELGHVAAGLLAGFEFRRVLVGPWMLTRESRGYRLRFLRGRFLAGGYTYVAPRSGEDLRRRFTVFAAGGPVVTALLFVPLVFLPWGTLTASLLMANLVLAGSSWLPLEIRGMYTDAKIILTLVHQGPEAERLAAVLYLMALDGRGIEPSQWPEAALAKLRTEGGGRGYRAASRIFLHIHARQTAPPAEVAAALERTLMLAGEMNSGLRRRCFSEAAFWQGVANHNAALANAWLADAQAVKGAVAEQDWDAAALAAIALAEGNQSQFREQLGRALANLDRQPGPSGSLDASRSLLLELANRPFA